MNREVRKLAWFVWRHYPPAKDWGWKRLQGWVEWHYERAFTAAFKDENDVVVALGIGKPVMNPEDAKHDCYVTDPEGSCIFVELAIAPNNRVFQGLGALMRRRFGIRETIAFKRYPSNEVKVYPYRRMMRLTIKKKEIAYGRS